MGALEPNCDYSYGCGDINLNDEVNVTDIMSLIDYYFSNGPEPPLEYTGDLNCDGSINLTDLVYLSQYVLHNGIASCCQ